MFNRMKEEERIERTIRNLLRLQDNRRCINCNSLGPQYVCTTFWTFVCTRCGGVHREFTHRVKSVSMAKFNEEEVSALEAGGNERAKEIYFKTWDPYRDSFPDPSNLHKLRDFMKHVYVERRYSGERSHDKLPMVKASLRDDYKEQRSFEISTPRDDDRRSFEKYSPRRSDDINLRYYIEERRSPRISQANLRIGRERSLPARFEIVDDRFREDGSGDVKRFQYHRSDSRRRSRSPASEKTGEQGSTPRIRPVKEILGEKVIPLEVGESPKQGDKVSDSSADGEKMAKEKAAVDVGSLIDLESDPQPQPTTSAQQTQQTALLEDSSIASNPASKVDNVSSVNLLASLLFDMTTPAVASTEIPTSAEVTSVATANSCNTTQPGGAAPAPAPAIYSSNGPPVASPIKNTLALPGLNDFIGKINNGQQVLSVKNEDSIVAVGNNSSNTQQSTATIEVSYGQQSTFQPAGNSEKQATNPSQAATVTTQNTSSANDPKSVGRKELPADLFTSGYSPATAAIAGWQFRPHGMMYGMQYYPSAMSISAFPNATKSQNPFDVGQEGPQAQAPQFPSMLPMQEALPNLSAPASVQLQQFPYALALAPQTTNYGMTIPGDVGQLNSMPFIRPQGNAGSGKDESAFASLNPLQHPKPATSNSFLSAGGNPFG